ncbi:hypothetical protein MFLAVUS_010657 [Mucor flavus]|uniref:Uncharacterized protein n=1 Tax=Mucor flavus TaxID=439312 RepID=A0ABP9ZDD7_9FUNG
MVMTQRKQMYAERDLYSEPTAVEQVAQHAVDQVITSLNRRPILSFFLFITDKEEWGQSTQLPRRYSFPAFGFAKQLGYEVYSACRKLLLADLDIIAEMNVKRNAERKSRIIWAREVKRNVDLYPISQEAFWSVGRRPYMTCARTYLVSSIPSLLASQLFRMKNSDCSLV